MGKVIIMLIKAPTIERPIIGESKPIKVVMELLRKIASSDYSVLIQGETGTGKELAANAIHDLSPRYQAQFVALNCAGLDGDLLESELFKATN